MEWNITGYILASLNRPFLWLIFSDRTILSSAGNDVRVRLWKATAGNVWRPAGHISVEQAEEQQVDIDMEDNPIAE